ncbi:MAG: pyridoxal phosphate-dependent aminotransferase [Flavobacteriales bacterium]|nr:pyridoxal phosphate-dependent aminotransferase [Flavobacteriales bacterium]
MEVSKRLQAVEESQTLVMTKKAREMAETGVKVINLSIGEPDFSTPKFIIEAAKKAMDDGFTHYPPVAGFMDLRKAISAKFKTQNNLNYAPEQVVVSAGAKHSIANVISSLIDEGDEVIIPAPYWVSYPEMVKMAGGIPVFLESGIENDYTFNLNDLKSKISSKTKLFLFSSPCNPSGTVFSEEFLKKVADILAPYPNIFVVSDEIYEHIQYGRSHVSIGTFPQLADRVVTVNGLSKAFAMTGWRIGYIGAPLWISKAVEKMQGQVTSGINSIAQKAAVAALEGSLEPTLEMVEIFEKRREILYNGLKEIPGLKPNYPQGAFYILPDVSYYFGKKNGDKIISNSLELSLYLLEDAHVSVVSGEGFGNAECIRISYATSENDLRTAIESIKNSLKKLA